MASDNEASCVSDPNFAVICSFLEQFGKTCGIEYPDIGSLQEMLDDSFEGILKNLPFNNSKIWFYQRERQW